MENQERIEAKVGILFQIADQYLSGQIPLEKAKELVGFEMVHIRPVQFEAMKVELGSRLKEAGAAKSEKLFELFKAYLSPPFNKLQVGHPLRNYYEENSKVRDYLLKIDQMEGEEVALEDWTSIYALLSGFRVHIERQGKNFYPRLIPIGMRLQVELAKELGNVILDEIEKNRVRLKNGDLVDFLYNQRSLSQISMDYLDLEERVLYPKALVSFTEDEFKGLRRADDQEGYAFIEQPADYIPKEAEKVEADLEFILPALLDAKEIGIIYFSLAGEVISVLGDQIEESDLQLSEELRRSLLDGSVKLRKYWYNQEDQIILITYSMVTDGLGKFRGILKTKENISEIKDFTDWNAERQQQKQETAAKAPVRKENREIDSAQNIAELFRMYPRFSEDFYHLDEDLIGLKGSFGMEILNETTVGMLAKSLRMDMNDLVDRVNRLLESY